MKKSSAIVLVVVLVLLGLGIGCYSFGRGLNVEAPILISPSVLPDGATSPVEGSYTVDTLQSTLTWTGSKVLGTDTAKTGTVQVKLGEINYSADISGDIVVDMTTLAATGQGNDKLTTHLKSDDFFSVDAFPEAQFHLMTFSRAGTSSETKFDVMGQLTIKGVTQDVSFPVTMYSRDGLLYVTGTATIDRTKFGIRYGSDKFFDNLKDKAIKDEFTLDIYLVANKK